MSKMEAGQRLGPYEILAQVGAGGMGEVYRARDTRLGREVAVKVLPSHLSVSAELRQRFEREARAVSSLNHPHICTLHDVGQQDGVHYLVMELLEGETLGARIARGPMPLDEVLRVAAQVADGLDRAHRQGIVHRDLKPGNIMLTKAGAKLLDFGLARAAGGPLSGAAGLTVDATLTSPLTAQGHIVGTFQYMSPEQLEGKEADHRSDIFSFAAVIYEMVSGRRAFPSANHASLIAAILKEEPAPLFIGTPMASEALERLVRTCLAKDPDQRWQSVGDIRRELLFIAESPSRPAVTRAAPAASGALSARAGWILALVMAAVAAPAWWLVARRGPAAPPAREMRFAIEAPLGGGRNFDLVESDFAIAPDNGRIVFAASDRQGVRRLYLREFSTLTPTPIQGTEGASRPFWSPDSRAIGFFAQQKLRRVNLAGGLPQALCDVEEGGHGTWSRRGVILFTASGLMKVADVGGTPERVTTPDASLGEDNHSNPVFLPDGDRFLFWARSATPEKRAVYIGSLDGAPPRRLFDSPFKASWIEPGYIVQIIGDSLTARRFDATTERFEGEPSILTQDLALALVPGLAGFSATSPRAAAWRSRPAQRTTEMRWFDREGRDRGALIPASSDVSIDLSPDGERAAVGRVAATGIRTAGGEPPTHIFVVDIARGVSTRLTTDDTRHDENPVWSPDGATIAFASHKQGGPSALFLRSATGSGQPRPIELAAGVSLLNPHPIDWSPDGKALLLQVASPTTDMDLALLRIDGSEAVWLTEAKGNDGQGQFSPDGRHIAYTSEESGDQEVYVMTLPSGSDRWQISSAGGYHPRWRRDGKELFYLDPAGMLMAVQVTLSPRFAASAPKPLFRAPALDPGFNFYGGQAGYDAAPDGLRFLVNSVVTAEESSPINVLLNWEPPAEGR